MHQCLSIPEIARSIFDVLPEKDVLPLILSCRSFLEPGLDAHWRVLRSFKQIAACFPDGLIKVKEETLVHENYENPQRVKFLQLRRALTATDLDRYLSRYANRIRVFNLELPFFYNSRDRTTFSIDLFQSLQLVTKWQPGVMSPLLKTFLWPNFDRDPYPSKEMPFSVFFSTCIGLFLGRNVETFKIPLVVHSSPVVLTTLQTALESMPQLKRLLFNPAQSSHLVVRCIRAAPWINLNHAEISSITLDVLLLLGTLPQLAYLKLGIPSVATNDSSSSSDQIQDIFPALKTLDLRSPKPAKFSDVLRFFHSSPIRSLTLLSWKPVATKEAEAVVMGFRQHLNHRTLRVLSWTEHPSMLNMQGTPDLRDIDVHDTIDISALFVFASLRSLILDLQKPVKLTQAEVAQIPVAWPAIRVLSLHNSTEHHVPLIDHTHVLSIVSKCSHLASLAVPFDASRLTGEETLTGSPLGLDWLYVDNDSSIYSPSRVLAFLKTNFTPSMALAGSKDKGMLTESDDESEPKPVTFRSRWKAVVDGWEEHRKAHR
ncbi:hypothetical protein DFP72DRAFT_873144 [Ephemerocybe angulata]|uniref:Uncharacterized protein n=1 Tax=Ephemerocybe angulata TaxID=980116 RepID=A0A8H6MC11_9AGAR|nr:hypothetical protein DFP72DRAFT_873144 [Tulosesus angulatus]